MSTTSLLEVVGVSKRFGRVVACDDVTLAVSSSEVRGLLGQNGAGKSTLMNIVGGILVPDQGTVRVAGRRIPSGDPAAAAAAGVGIVHQHLSLVEALTVWENVTLGERGRVDARAITEDLGALSDRYGLDIEPGAVVRALSPAQRQRVEILKCLRRHPRVLMLDEPTSVLGRHESMRLFAVLRRLVEEEHLAVVLISHRLEEMMETTDSVTIMREGRVVATVPTVDTTPAKLAREMLGREMAADEEVAAVGAGLEREVELAVSQAAPSTTGSRVVLDVDDVTVEGRDGSRLLDGCTFSMRAGEILGVAGVEGNGQRALVDVLSGMHVPLRGRVRVDEREVSWSTRGAPPGVGVVPEDRHDAGCILQLSVLDNLFLGRGREFSRFGVLDRRRMSAEARRVIAEYDIRTPRIEAPMWALSGGNQQRLILARELERNPVVLVAAQPTHGLDVGAIEDMWERLRSAARGGAGVLLISTDLDEILALADRIAVIQKGRIVGEMECMHLDSERLALLLGGEAA